MSEEPTALPEKGQPIASNDDGPGEAKHFSIDDVLDEDHRIAFTQGINRVLSTEPAEFTYAQIIDGLPTVEVALDASDGGPVDDHPIHDAHQELCPGVLDQTRDFRDAFDPSMLRFNSSVILEYQAASPGSRAFKTRLIEMIAIATHQIAVLAFKQDTSRHKDEGITEWAPPQSDEVFWHWYRNGIPPTLFHHPWYLDHEQYPEGVADIVGYWAEARILGGVVLFDRRPDGDPDAVYIHPNRGDKTYRICLLLPEQKQALLDFLLVEPPLRESPLPILPSQENRERVDPEEPIVGTGVYRDIWERKEPPPPDASDRRLADVWEKDDFPTLADKGAAWDRAAERKWAYEHAQAMADLQQKIQADASQQP